MACDSSADCLVGECVDRTCRPIIPCRNSLDCGRDICDSARGRCVACVSDRDCDGLRCVGSACRSPCVSDRECTGSGLLCNPSTGTCAACAASTDCGDGDACVEGVCSPPACIDGATACWSDAVATCSGGVFGSPVPCPSAQTCEVSGATATCVGPGGAGGATGAGGAGAGGVAGSGGAGSGGAGPDLACGSGLELWLLVDESRSMGNQLGSATRWRVVTDAIQGFADWSSPDVSVSAGLVFFPKGDPGAPSSCCTDSDCGAFGPCTQAIQFPGFPCFGGTCAGASGCAPAGYSPALPPTSLPDTGLLIAGTLAAEAPEGSTPTAAALEGTLDQALLSAAAKPGPRRAIVLITDGAPAGCTDNTVEAVADVATRARSGSPSMATYVITLGVEPATLEPVATAGGTVVRGVPDTATATQAVAGIGDMLRAVVTDACAP